MAEFETTDWFTLVPKEIKGEGDELKRTYRRIMEELYPISDSDEVFFIDVPEYEAVLLYSWKPGSNAAKDSKPEIYRYLSALPGLSEHNKAILRYGKAENSGESPTLIIVADGDRLITANHYHTTDFGSAIYYLMEILRQSQINPQQTSVHLFGEITREEIEMAARYVRGCIVNRL